MMSLSAAYRRSNHEPMGAGSSIAVDASQSQAEFFLLISREGKLSQKSLNTLMSHWSGLHLRPTLKLTTIKGSEVILIAWKD